MKLTYFSIKYFNESIQNIFKYLTGEEAFKIIDNISDDEILKLILMWLNKNERKLFHFIFFTELIELLRVFVKDELHNSWKNLFSFHDIIIKKIKNFLNSEELKKLYKRKLKKQHH